jgi:hypothetical protein
MERKHHKYFVGHKKPEFIIWEKFLFYENSNSKSFKNKQHNETYFNHKIFNEYASLFALKNTFSSLIADNELITICQYRRFILNKKLGRPSKVMPWTRVLTYEEINSLSITNEYMPLNGNQYLTGSIIKIDGLMQQYASHHFLRDILKFTSILIDLGLLSNEEALLFLNQKYLIPSPSCGTFKLSCFISIFEILELAAIGFYEKGFKPYDDPYQSRVMAFLLERLNSFLLISHLQKNSLNINNISGITTMVTDKNTNDSDVKRGVVLDY